MARSRRPLRFAVSTALLVAPLGAACTNGAGEKRVNEGPVEQPEPEPPTVNEGPVTPPVEADSGTPAAETGADPKPLVQDNVNPGPEPDPKPEPEVAPKPEPEKRVNTVREPDPPK